MKIILTKAVRHAGKPYNKGDTLDVPELSARWLIDQKAAEEVKPKPQPKTKDKP